MNKSIFCVFFLLAAIDSAESQQKKASCQIVPEWGNIMLVSDPIPDTLPKILVVTNRPFIPEPKDNKFFPNGIAHYRKVTYLEAACKDGDWLVKIYEDFNDAMETLDNRKDILLFVHGHGKSLPRSLPRAMQVKERYDVSLIVFDWPAKNSNFNRSLARVRRCGENFYNLLLNLKNYRANIMHEDQSLNILAHSLGNYFLTHFVVNGSWQYLSQPFIDNIIFNAPAVRSKEHGEVLSRITISKKKYVVLNKNDWILKTAHFLTSGKMLGNKVIKPYADNTIYFHFTNIAGKEHTYFVGYHKFENESSVVFNLYNSMIHGREPDLSAPGLQKIEDNEYMLE